MEGTLLNWLPMFITLAVNLATVAYMSGSISARITQFEKEMSKVESELKEMRSLLPALATIRAQLDMLGQNVNELKNLVKKDLGADA